MGWNGSNSRRTDVRNIKKPKMNRLCNRFIIIPVLIIGMLVSIVMLTKSNYVPDKKKIDETSVKVKRQAHKDKKTKTFNHKPPKKVESTQTPDNSNVNPIWANAKGLDPSLFPYTDGRKVIKTKTNQWIAVDICIMPNGVRRKVRRNVSKQLFSSVTDQVLLQAISTGGDEVGPPIPFSEDMEEDFIESLKKPIVINEDDTPEQRELKEQVIAAREAVIDHINNGRSFFDAVNEHIAAQASNQSARETVMDAVEELKANGESDLIEKYLEESNKILENMGASPITISDISEDE